MCGTLLRGKQTRKRQNVCSLLSITEALRIEAMEEDTGEDIIAYLPKEYMAKVALVSMGLGNKVQDTHISRQRYKLLSARRLRRCINIMQEATGRT